MVMVPGVNDSLDLETAYFPVLGCLPWSTVIICNNAAVERIESCQAPPPSSYVQTLFDLFSVSPSSNRLPESPSNQISIPTPSRSCPPSSF